MKLHEYRQLAKIQRNRFAESINVSEMTVYRWETGKAFPSKEHLQDIQRVTNGAVMANDFVDLRDDHEK